MSDVSKRALLRSTEIAKETEERAEALNVQVLELEHAVTARMEQIAVNDAEIMSFRQQLLNSTEELEFFKVCCYS